MAESRVRVVQTGDRVVRWFDGRVQIVLFDRCGRIVGTRVGAVERPPVQADQFVSRVRIASDLISLVGGIQFRSFLSIDLVLNFLLVQKIRFELAGPSEQTRG